MSETMTVSARPNTGTMTGQLKWSNALGITSAKRSMRATILVALMTVGATKTVTITDIPASPVGRPVRRGSAMVDWARAVP
jgi:hypothetical protein